MTAPRAVCFDLDGTLFDHRGAARDGVTAFLRGLGVPVTEAALAAWSLAEDEQFERWRAGQVSFAEHRRQRLRTVLPPLGVRLPEDDDGLDALFDDYLSAYRLAWRLFPGCCVLLRDLRARGFRLGLLTNGTQEQQHDKLAVTGIEDAFDAVCVSERIGFQKPDVRAFRTLATALGVDPGDCLFVGDDAERDVAGARAAGMRAVLVRPGDADAGGVAGAVRSALAE